jgi:CheY-like chemotaxis protein
VLILDVPGVLAAETADGGVDTLARPGVEPPSRAGAVAVHEVAPSAAPHEVAAAVVSAAEDAAPALIPVPPGQRRVLFVDDSLSVRKVAERMLRSLGVDVITAVDGQDALDKLRAMAFSLVFTDLEMPRLHGYDLIREMQYLPTYAATPIVVISSRSGQKHIDQALAMGAREYITKPFSSEILNAVLARWTRRQPAAS